MKLSELGMSPDSGRSFECAEDGTYVCELTEITVRPYPSFDDPTILEDKLVFVYETLEAVDENDNPYKFFDFIRKVRYLTDNSNLAKRLDQMLGRRLSAEEFGDFDLDELKEQRWRVTVTENNGRNKIFSVKPARKSGHHTIDAPVQKPKNKPAPKVEVDADALEDPFAE